MAPRAAYDEIADWYHQEFLGGSEGASGQGDEPGSDPLGIKAAIGDLLGPGRGTCLEVGCGTAVRARLLRRLGWSPVGVDLSSGMLRHARGRMPIGQGDAERLPVRTEALRAAVGVMVHTDMPGYPAVVSEVARVLRPGGVYVHVGVHPCFCGGFADRSDPTAVVIRPGYVDGHWTRSSWTDKGVRDKVGASHFPIPELMGAFLRAGLSLEGFTEGGRPTPTVLGIRARKRP